MEKTKASIRKLLLLSLAVVMLLSFMAGCGNNEQTDPTDGTVQAGSEAEQSFRDQMADSSVQEITLSGNVVLTTPVEVSGTKVIVGDGTVTAAENLEGEYLFLVCAGADLTVGDNVTVDAAGLVGGIHVAKNASLTLKDSAVVKNASAGAANAFVEGAFRLEGGNLADAQGHNLINESETVIVGGEITGSGEGFAGIYNAGKLTQDGGTISACYNNIVNASGSSFDWNSGVVQNAIYDGIQVEEGAKLYVASKEAQLLSSGGRGILLNGNAVIDGITLKSCVDTQLKVGENATLELGGGVITGGAYHGIDNAGTMTITGGDIFSNAECGIVNTGKLDISAAGIMSNGNKGILNKHAGKVTIASEDVMLSGNKIAIGNEDTAYFELSKASIMQSSMTNIYAYGGEMYIHDIALNASSSNNVRIVSGNVTMKDVEVKGNSSSGSTSMHGILMEGGTLNAENVTICNTTGAGIRNKGGQITGYNVTIRNVNGDAAISNTTLSDGSSGTITLYNVSISGVKSKNIVSNAGTINVYNSTLSATPGSNIKITGGRVALNNVNVMGSDATAEGTIHAIILESGYGALSLQDVTIANAKVSAIRNKSGVVTGKNVTIKDSGTSAISNGADATVGLKGVTTIDGLTVTGSGNNNIVVDAGEITVSNATLAPTASNNVKAASGLLTLKDSVVEGSTGSYGVIAEGGNIELINVTIKDTKNAGIRVNKEASTISGKNVIIDNTQSHALSVDKGTVIIDGLTTTNIGQRNVQVGTSASVAEDGTETPANGGIVKITNGDLCVTENQHSLVAYGDGAATLLELNNVVVQGTGADRHGILAEGGTVKLTDVTINGAKSAAIRINRASSSVEGTNVTIDNCVNGISGSAGTVNITGLTANASSRNIAGEGADIVIDGAVLGTTSTHNIKINKGSLSLKNTVMEGSSGRGIMIEPGASDGQPIVDLENVTISNTASQALENRGGIVTAKDLTIDTPKGHGVYNMIHKDGKTCGTIEIDGLYTSGITANSVLQDCEGTVTVTGGILGATGEKGAATPSSVKVTKGTINLIGLTIEGTTVSGAHGVMAEGGDVNLENVIIKNTKGSGIRVNKDASTVVANNITIEGAGEGAVYASAGTVTVKGYTSTGNSRSVDVSGATVTITDAVMGKTTTHNVKASAGTVTLTDAVIEGSGAHGIIAEGGDFVLTNVTIHNTTQSGIRMNKSASEVRATNLTIEDCTNGISANAGTIVVDSLTAKTTGVNVIAEGASITIGNGVLTNSGSANVVAHTGGTLNLENVEVGAAGEGFYQIYNTAENLNLSGKIAGDILNDKAVTVNVAAALSEDTAIVIDWTEGNAPSGTAIAFAEGTVEAGKGCFTLGEIQSNTKELIFTGNSGILKSLSDYVAQIGSNKYESLEEAAAAMGQLTGDVTLTILADCGAADPIVVPEGVNLTIQGGEAVVGVDAVVQVSEGATLTIGEKVNISGVDVAAGGSVVYAGNTATAESPLDVIVNGGPHEVALTLAEGSAATADMFKLVDAEGNLYGSMIEDGKVKIYTKDVTDTEALQAAISGAPINAKGFIVLKDDISLTSQVVINEGIDLTVLDDGNKRSIVRDTSVMPTVDFIIVNKGSKLTITGSSDENRILLDSKKKNNLISVKGGDVVLTNVDVKNAGTGGSSLVNFLGGTFTAANCNFDVAKHAVCMGTGLTAEDVVTLTDVTMTNSGSNMIVAASGIVNLNGTTTISGVGSETGHHGIYVNGGIVNATGTLSVTANKGCAVRISSNTAGSFTGEIVNLTAPSNYAVNMDAGSFTVTKGGSISGTRSFQLGVNGDASSATVNLTGVTLAESASGQHNIKAARGTITLTDVTMEGAGSHGVILEGGTPELILNNVTFKNVTSNAIYSKTATVTGTNVTVLDSKTAVCGLESSKKIDITNLTVSGCGENISVNSGELKISGADLGEASTWGITISGSATAELSDISGAGSAVKVEGTAALTVSGKIAAPITINNATALNVAGALTEGSNLIVDWAADMAPADAAITFPSDEVMNASKGYITLGEIQSASYELSYGETAATLIAKGAATMSAKTAASGLKLEADAQEQ